MECLLLLLLIPLFLFETRLRAFSIFFYSKVLWNHFARDFRKPEKSIEFHRNWPKFLKAAKILTEMLCMAVSFGYVDRNEISRKFHPTQNKFHNYAWNSKTNIDLFIHIRSFLIHVVTNCIEEHCKCVGT